MNINEITVVVPDWLIALPLRLKRDNLLRFKCVAVRFERTLITPVDLANQSIHIIITTRLNHIATSLYMIQYTVH
jgi:hypothetical protein